MINQWIYGTLFIVLLYFAYKISKKKPDEKIPEYKDPHRPNKEFMPDSFVDNKKFIYIANISQKEITNVTIQFCNMYNHDFYQAILKITPIKHNTFIITFPYDIEFANYLILINYLHYPFEIEYSPKISGWMPLTNEVQNEQESWGMFYIPSDDKEYNPVYMLTENNNSYKFTIGLDKGIPCTTNFIYKEPPLLNLNSKEKESFIIN